ncbi:DUF6600 domain-containing protein [Acidobacteriota bacterium]
MKKLLTFTAIFMFCLPLVFSFQSSDYDDDSIARMSYVKGDVFLQRASDMGFEEGSVNLPLIESDKLGTRDGRAEVHFGRKNYIRIDRYTHIDLAKLASRGNSQVRLNFLSGNVYLRVSFLERQKDFEVHTPDASFYILEEGLYGFRVIENSKTEVRVLAGTIEAAGEEGSVVVNAEERLVAANGVFPSDPEYAFDREVDSFADWNRSRDALLRRSAKKTYLPDELDAYEEELAYNGNWVYEAPYGNVWVPNVYHHTWRPYHYGRWGWYASFGWCWIPSEPWGWCVSHYGRWHWRFGLGWYWIPSSGWGPAWVHWHCGSNYIGWCPISHYGYPVVIAHNRFYGRHYGGHYPLHSRALTVVHKNQLQSRRISKVALSQNGVKRLGKVSLASRQPGARLAAQKAGVRNATAAKVLARSNMRKVGQSYKGSSNTRSTGRSRATRVGGSNKGASSARSLRSPSSVRSQTGQMSKSSRIGSSFSAQRTKSPDSTGLSSSRRGQSRGAIKTYPSRQGAIANPRSSGRNSGSRSSSWESRNRASVKYYQSRSDAGSDERSGSLSRRSYPSQGEKTYSSSSRSSSIGRYPSRKSQSSSRQQGQVSDTRRYQSTTGENYRSTKSYSGRSSRSYEYKSNSRYSSPSRSSRSYSGSSPSLSSGRSYSRGNVSSSRSSSRGSYSSPSRSSRSYSRSSPSRSSSRSYSRSSPSRSSGKSYSRGSVSSSRSSPSRSSRSSSSSRTSRSSSKSSRRK